MFGSQDKVLWVWNFGHQRRAKYGCHWPQRTKTQTQSKKPQSPPEKRDLLILSALTCTLDQHWSSFQQALIGTGVQYREEIVWFGIKTTTKKHLSVNKCWKDGISSESVCLCCLVCLFYSSPMHISLETHLVTKRSCCEWGCLKWHLIVKIT